MHLDSRHRDNDILLLDLSLNVSTLMEIRLYQSSTEMLQAGFNGSRAIKVMFKQRSREWRTLVEFHLNIHCSFP